jgi:hypothetical protein
MPKIKLTKTETALLVAAASAGGLAFPDQMRPATRTRLIARFERDGLISADEAGHHLTPAGYRAVGLRPPRRAKSEGEGGNASAAPLTAPAAPAPCGTKQTLVLELLGRGQGASLPELMKATGWLPHTTRAALSRLRASGTELTRTKREDGTTFYRTLPPEPTPARRTRNARDEAAEAVA